MYSFPTTVVEERLSLSLHPVAFPTVSCEILLEITSQTNKKQTWEMCYTHSAEEIDIIAGETGIQKIQAVPYIFFLLRHQFISQSSQVRVEAMYSLFLGTVLQGGRGQEVLLEDAL
uniref:Uncharacterized protein n=1 Tax=Pongo abelii TaxID=9601 RepID=H2PUM8_PONAB